MIQKQAALTDCQEETLALWAVGMCVRERKKKREREEERGCRSVEEGKVGISLMKSYRKSMSH